MREKKRGKGLFFFSQRKQGAGCCIKVRFPHNGRNDGDDGVSSPLSGKYHTDNFFFTLSCLYVFSHRLMPCSW